MSVLDAEILSDA